MRVKAILLALALALAVSSSLVSAQPPQPPTFRSGVDLIEVDVSVLGDQGNPVPDLRAPEFAVTVDGQERRIVSVEFVKFDGSTESSAAEPLGSQPYYSTNQAVARGQLVMLVVDQGNIRFGNARGLIAPASRFLDQLGPADRVAFASIGPGGDRLVGFTRNQDLIRQALEQVAGQAQNVQGRFNVSVAEAIAVNQNRRPELLAELVERECGRLRTGEARRVCIGDLRWEANMIDMEVREQTLRLVRALRPMVEAMGRIEGPKALVLISQGLVVEDEEAPLIELGATAAAARVTIHTLLINTNDASVRRLAARPRRDQQLREDGLELLSAQTGGGLFRLVGVTDAAFERLTRELSGYYVLGVETDPADRDGERHQIRVDVRRTGTRVRARRQFQVVSDTPARSDEELLMQALEAPFPFRDLPLRLATYAYHDSATSSARVVLAVEAEQAMESSSELGIAFAVFDRDGEVVADSVERATLTPTDRGASSRVLSYVRGFLVEPGIYTLRLAAIDEGGRLGSIEHEVQAWEVSGEQLAIGDLIVDNAPSGPGEGIQPGVDVRLDTGQLAAYLELYADDPETFGEAEVAIEVADDETGPALTSGAATLRAMTDPHDRAAAAVLPVGELPAGQYIARAVVSLSGAVVGKLVRPFHIPPEAVGVRGESTVASLPRPVRSPAVLPTVAPFRLDDVLSAEVMTSFLDILHAARPDARPAVARARDGRLSGAARQAFEAGDHLSASFLRGLELFTQGQLDRAATQFQASLRIEPDFAPAAFYLGASHAAAGRDRAAAAMWRQAVAGDGPAALTYGLLADALLRSGDAALALDPLVEALGQWPDDDEIRRRLAMAHAMAGQHDEALSTIEPYLSRHPSDHEALLVAIQALYEARLAGRSVTTPEQDRESVGRYAAAYADANGPHLALVSKWEEFVAQAEP